MSVLGLVLGMALAAGLIVLFAWIETRPVTRGYASSDEPIDELPRRGVKAAGQWLPRR